MTLQDNQLLWFFLLVLANYAAIGIGFHLAKRQLRRQYDQAVDELNSIIKQKGSVDGQTIADKLFGVFKDC